MAAATPWGVAALAVVRLSGAGVDELVRRVCGRLSLPRRASKVRLRDAGGVFDEGLLVWMPGPASYTGEDCAEVSCHGNPLLVERLLGAFRAAGARLAEPGEFTRRALLNGRMDLLDAEGVLQLVEATSAEGLRLARDAPRIAARVAELREQLVDVAAALEVSLDYPGEGLADEDDDALAARLRAVAEVSERAAASWRAGRLVVEGARVVLVGPVNAGKSTLLNGLVGRERALVSPEPGTTRDVVEAALMLPRLRVTLVDTAGEREAPGTVEAAGLELGRRAAAVADLRLVCVPLDRPPDPLLVTLLAEVPAPRLVVGTFADLPVVSRLPVDLAVSARTGHGLDALRARLESTLLATPSAAGDLVIGSARQAELFTALAVEARSAASAVGGPAGPVVAAEHVYAGVGLVDALTGRDTRGEVLDRLFARFCIGK